MHLGAFVTELGFWMIVLSGLGAAVHFAWRFMGKRPRG